MPRTLIRGGSSCRYGGRAEFSDEPAQLAASLSRYGVPIGLIDSDPFDGEAIVSALGPRAFGRQALSGAGFTLSGRLVAQAVPKLFLVAQSR